MPKWQAEILEAGLPTLRAKLAIEAPLYDVHGSPEQVYRLYKQAGESETIARLAEQYRRKAEESAG